MSLTLLSCSMTYAVCSIASIRIGRDVCIVPHQAKQLSLSRGVVYTLSSDHIAIYLGRTIWGVHLQILRIDQILLDKLPCPPYLDYI